MAERLRRKPQGPSRQRIRFRCGCGAVNVVAENYSGFHDCGDGDSLDHDCPACGTYYKKTCRIPSGSVLEAWYEEAD
jgi:hypothetical protein